MELRNRVFFRSDMATLRSTIWIQRYMATRHKYHDYNRDIPDGVLASKYSEP